MATLKPLKVLIVFANIGPQKASPGGAASAAALEDAPGRGSSQHISSRAPLAPQSRA